MLDLLYKWRWWIWAASTMLWTTALLVPVPLKEPWTIGETEFDVKAIFAKTLHVSAYAFLTAIAGWLAAPTRYRAFIVFFLMAHGTSTELVQRTMESLGRTGKLYDVGWDNLGVAIGLLLTWKWWTADEVQRAAPKAWRENNAAEPEASATVERVRR